MAAEVLESVDQGILTIELIGTVSFHQPDFEMRDKLVRLVREHTANGGRHLLLDLRRTRINYFSSSSALVFFPFLDPGVRDKCRIAACLPEDEDFRWRIEATGWNRALDFFAGREDAVQFLLSDKPMTEQAAYNDQLWSALGPEDGPEQCKREHCAKLKIEHSLYCREHHYRTVMGVMYLGNG